MISATRRGALLPLLAVLSMCPGVSGAQQTGSPVGDLMDLNRFATRGMMNQWAATRPAALSGLSRDADEWMKDQVQIQAETPRAPEEVLKAVNETLGNAVAQAAETERVRPDDVSRALVMKIMMDTKLALMREARRTKGVAEPGMPSWNDRIAVADANRRTALGLQSAGSLILAAD